MKRPAQLLLRIGPYLVALAVLALVRQSGLAQTVDLPLYDLIISRREAPSGLDSPITLIGIEESDIQRYGWPIDDGLFCRGIDGLRRGGASAIGFDLYRDQGVGPEQQCLRDCFRQEPTLVSIFNVASGIAAVPGTPAERQSYNDLSLDADGVLRRDLVHVTGQDEATVSFAMRVMEVATGERSIRRSIDAGTDDDAWLAADAGGYHNEIEAGLGLQRMLLYRQPGSYRRYTLEQWLENSIPADAIRDQIVLIGSTAPSLRDLFEVPFSRFHSGVEMFQLPGLEIHANRIATLLDSRSNSAALIWTMPGWGNRLLLVVSLLAGLALGEAIPTLRRSVLVVTAVAGAGAAGLLGLLFWSQVWVGTALPLTGLLSMAGAAWLRRGAVSQQHSQQIRRLLGQATSPAVAQQLWDQREELLSNGRFEGQQLLITVLFTDTASFTSVSERLSPRELMDWLNRGMAICVPAVTRRGGMVNKFTGDGMLAVFGVPVRQDPTAEAAAALEAAREIQAGLEQLNAELLQEGAPEMRVRAGIHSGEALVGSMGSADRIEYAVIGDTVNCASRLESLDKQRHQGVMRVLLSSNTLDILDPTIRQQLQLESWGSVQVKGRDEPLEVSELRMGNEPVTTQANPT